MEENIIKNTEVVQKNEGNRIIFQLKNPKQVNRTIMSELKKEMSYPDMDSSVITPEQKIIDSNQIYLEGTSIIISEI